MYLSKINENDFKSSNKKYIKPYNFMDISDINKLKKPKKFIRCSLKERLIYEKYNFPVKGIINKL